MILFLHYCDDFIIITTKKASLSAIYVYSVTV